MYLDIVRRRFLTFYGIVMLQTIKTKKLNHQEFDGSVTGVESCGICFLKVAMKNCVLYKIL